MPRLLLAAALVIPAFAQLPDFYHTVSRIVWVTRDANRAADAWARFGLSDLERQGEISLPVDFRGRPATARIRLTVAQFGPVMVDFVEPLGGANAYAEFLARHGEGIFALVHEAPTEQAFNREAARMRRLGVGVLQAGNEPAAHIYFDTAPRGKYVLGLIFAPEDTPPAGASPIIAQFAFVVREFGPVSDYWQSLGWPAITVTKSAVRDGVYRGKPAPYDLQLGWQRHGAAPYEWCLPPAGVGSVYREFLDRHGEGVQHLGIQVPDMDKAIAEAGFAVVQSGAWGEPGAKGSGRFAYVDTEPAGGVTAELLWSFK